MTSNSDCIFCSIARGDVPTELVYETDDVVGFRDVNPQAPAHILIVPRDHVPSLDELYDQRLAGALLVAAAEVARQQGLVEDGYRTVINIGSAAGQTVDHLHVHVLGGRRMGWPPG